MQLTLLHEVLFCINYPSFAGVEHESYFCDICNEPGEFNECIKGFRWQCLYCNDYDLCNKCYMEDEHDATHKFQRVIAPNKWYFVNIQLYTNMIGDCFLAFLYTPSPKKKQKKNCTSIFMNKRVNASPH